MLLRWKLSVLSAAAIMLLNSQPGKNRETVSSSITDQASRGTAG